MALAGGAGVGEPSAVSGVAAGVNSGVGGANGAADGVDGVPNTFTTSVGLVVAVGFGGMSVAGGAAFTGALDFKDHVTEQVAVGHVLSVEGEGGAGGDLITVALGTGETSREGGPVEDVG